MCFFGSYLVLASTSLIEDLDNLFGLPFRRVVIDVFDNALFRKLCDVPAATSGWFFLCFVVSTVCLGGCSTGWLTVNSVNCSPNCSTFCSGFTMGCCSIVDSNNWDWIFSVIDGVWIRVIDMPERTFEVWITGIGVDWLPDSGTENDSSLLPSICNWAKILFSCALNCLSCLSFLPFRA